MKKLILIISMALASSIAFAQNSNDNTLYIIDGVVSQQRANEAHWQLIREIMQLPAVKVIEHPDIFIQATEYTIDDFDYIIEIRRDEDEEITYEPVEKEMRFNDGFSMFEF